jgi:glycosyltransferase XagB
MRAALQARQQGVPPEAALLASGALREDFYYRCLADTLGAQFTCGQARLSDAARYPYGVHAGLLPLEGGNGPQWLAAPRGRLLNELLARSDSKLLARFLTITTPSHLSRLARSAAAVSILRDASLGLACLDPDAMAGFAATAFAIGAAPGPALVMVSLAMTCLFLASIWLRLFAGAASSACCTGSFQARLQDRWLPY